MAGTPTDYTPCLRWKQGEYQAIKRSTKHVIEQITPLIEVPEFGYDFEKKAQSKSIDDHLGPFAKRVLAKLGPRACYVDLCHLDPSMRMSTGIHPARFVFDSLRENDVPAVPVFDLRQDSACFSALHSATREDKRGACLRLRLEDIAGRDGKRQLEQIVSNLGCTPAECDLILDLEAPSFTPLEGLGSLLTRVVGELPHLPEWRSFTVLGTSFPSTTAEIQRGISTVPRNEWLLYKVLLEKFDAAGLRAPRFGDYCIAHPEVVQMDMRYVKPNATVRYTVSDAWLVAKGKNVRDYKYGQFRDLCKMVVASSDFEGSGASMGDKYIEDCACGKESTGNLSTWRWVGTNRHLAKVVKDVSNLSETSFSP